MSSTSYFKLLKNQVMYLLSSPCYLLKKFFCQVFNDAIEALRISYKKMNPFCIPFATTNMGSAILAMDLVKFKGNVGIVG